MSKWDELDGVQQAVLEDILHEPTKMFYHSQMRAMDQLIEMGLAKKIAYNTFVATDLGRRVWSSSEAPAPAELPHPAAPATAQVAGGGEVGAYVPCAGEPIDMFIRGWLNSPLTKIYAGRKIAVSHHSKDGNYLVEVDGQTQASVSEDWFWRHVADGYRQAAEDARARAAAAEAAIAHVEVNLGAIQDYVFAPDAPSVNAENMTTEERISGMVSHALDGLQVIEDWKDAVARQTATQPATEPGNGTVTLPPAE